MLRGKLTIISVFLVTFLVTLSVIHLSTNNNTPQRILDTVVEVNGASGIIINSDDKYAFVITNYHVVDNLINLDGSFVTPLITKITFKIDIGTNKKHAVRLFTYNCVDAEISVEDDLAVLKIETNVKLNYSKIATKEPAVGDELFIVGNPNYNYRTIARGTLGSKNRVVRHKNVWQISGGVIFGASGGGAFDKDGKIVAITRSVDIRETRFCETKNIEKISFRQCYDDPIFYIGYFIPMDTVKKFLLSTKFNYGFEYLR